MSSGIKLRLLALGLSLAILGALIVVVVLSSQKQASELRARLSQVDVESFGIAEQFKDRLRGVTDKMRFYRATHDSGSWEAFLQASHELDVWMDQQAPKLTTQHEKSVLKQIDSAYDDYLSVARTLHDPIPVSAQTNIVHDESSNILEHVRRLSDLGQALARAHYDSRNQLLAHANTTLTRLRTWVLVLVGMLFLFGTALAVVVYRQMIAPLRARLDETIALAERHEKLASLGMLAAGVAHEIRNPLTAIKAALFRQQKKLSPGSPERSDSESVQREIVRLEKIVNDFLQFARPADPELVTLPADLPLREVEGLLGNSLAKTGIQLVREPSPAFQIQADLGQIKQVLINLVQNAADSMQGQGIITLRARHDRKRISNGETDVVILDVLDTGTGIPPEIQKRLFDPFFTTKARGAGLGLPIAARIVEKHGGALQYQNRPNQGAIFSIILPEVIA
jgi:signal transduction histidine kinase